ncbi:MAG: hypothetical protein Q4B50_02335 [Bacillota bacterium]|nr:hypothetical protein [Bacillota bacterium]
MSYCVNCGVELAESEKYCPLCQTEVLNPRSPWKEPTTRPYPPRLERLMKRIDRRYLAILLGAFMLLPVLVTMLCDLLSGDGMSWSAYVLAAGFLLAVWILLPLWMKKFYPVSCLAMDGLATLLFLFTVEQISGGSWFLLLAAPITIFAFAAPMLLIFLFRKRWAQRLLTRIALFLLICSVFCMLVEVTIDFFVARQLTMNWALFVLVPCLTLALAALILDSKQKLKDEILKRMFY